MLLFVYGTLRRGHRHPMARLLALQGGYLGQARTSGRLYRVGSYPAAVMTKRSGEYIWGDLYSLRDERGLLARLDSYEGIDQGRLHGREYRRAEVEVELADGTLYAAWTYLYNGSIVRLPRLVTGDFIAQRRRTTQR